MGLKCSLLGHTFDETDVERDRRQRGNEVVTVVRDVERCSRCGAERIVAENKEVTSASADGNAPGRSDAAARRRGQWPGEADRAGLDAVDADRPGPDRPGGAAPEESTRSGADAPPAGDPAGTTEDDGTIDGLLKRSRAFDFGSDEDEGAREEAGAAGGSGADAAAGQTDGGDGPADAGGPGGERGGRAPEGTSGPADRPGDAGRGAAAERGGAGGPGTAGGPGNAGGSPGGLADGPPGAGSFNDDEFQPPADPAEEDAEILSDEPGEREPGQWPDDSGGAGDARPGASGAASGGSPEGDFEPAPDPEGGSGRGSGTGESFTVPEGSLACPTCGHAVSAASSFRAGDACPECQRGYLEGRE